MKLAKLSLAAIMTVGALSTVNAQPLEEAIKNVDFTGMVRYRLNDVTDETSNVSENDFDVLGKVTVPVTDNIKFVGAFATNGGDNDNHSEGPKADNMDLRKMFFVYKQDALTVKAGLQAVDTPITDPGFNGDKGNGVVAMYNVGPVTLVGAYFGNHNNGTVSKDEELTVLSAMGSFGPVNAQAWYITSEQTIDSSLGLQVDGKFAGVSLKGQVFQTTLQDIVAPAEDKGLWYAVQAGYAMDNFSVNAGYIKNDEDQGTHTLTKDGGGLIWAGWRLGYFVENAPDAEAMFADVGGTFGKFGARIGYAKASVDRAAKAAGAGSFKFDTTTGTSVPVAGTPAVTALDNSDIDEIWGQVSYKVSKNLNTYVKYSVISFDEANVDDRKHMRFEAKYSF